METKPLVIILMGSPSDLPHVEKICDYLTQFGIKYQRRIASAHKTPEKLLTILREYESQGGPKVYITVAGRSNALSGMVDAQVSAPVIACPPESSAFGGADLFSSLRMPSGVAPMLVLDPGNAALAAAKILSAGEPTLTAAIKEFQAKNHERLITADKDLNNK